MPIFACFTAAALAVSAGDTRHAEPLKEGDEIVITGERVPRSRRETAASVTVITADQIDQQAAPDRVEQLLDLIPNVQMGSGGEGPTIRGQDTTGAMRDLPAFLGGTRPRTTLIVDGRAVSYNEFVFGIAPVWDLERLEVFRTPQTTTQGRNSIAGAIFVHTRDPTFQWEGRARAIAGDLRTRQISAAVSGPLVADQLALRMAGDYRKSRPSSDIADRMRGADPDRDEYGQLRFKLLARPKALPGSSVELTYAHIQSQMPQIEGVRAPFHERRDPLDGYGVFRTNVDSLTSAIAYEATDNLTVSATATGGDANVRRFAPAGLGQTRIRTKDWSAEVVASWNPDTRLRATGGVSRTRARLDQFINLSALAGIGEFDDRQDSTGLFGEVSWSLSRRVSLTGGLRYQHDWQERRGFLQGPASPINLAYERSFDAWLPKLSFAYDVSPGLTIGALAQRAYNPGGTSLRFDTGEPDEFKAETLWDYEIFARASLAGGAITAEANLFHYDIRDAQRSRAIVVIAPTGAPVTFADLFNVSRARSHGLEAALEWRASGRLSARASLGLLGTKITRTDSGGELLGKEFPRSPHFTASAAIDWRPIDQLRLSAQFRRDSGYFSDDRENPALRVARSARLDARAAWETDRFTLFGYARNILDDFAMRQLFTPTFGVANDPRELGVGVGAQF